MPNVYIPKEYERKRMLVAVPKKEYEEFVALRVARAKRGAPLTEWRKLRGAGRSITERDIDEAIRAVRQESR